MISRRVDDAAAERRARNRAQRRTSERPATCTHPGCGTVLSAYNDDDVCYQHRPSTIMRRRVG